MRKRSVRNGMRLVNAALVMIVLVSFFHAQLSDLLSLSLTAESQVYTYGIFCAGAIGGYGVVLTVLGFIRSPLKNDAHVRILPVFLGISVMIFLFFYLLSTSMESPARDEQRRVRPGEAITI